MSLVPRKAHEHFFLRIVLGCFLVAAFALTRVTPAAAQDAKAIAKVTDLNKKALEAYAVSDFAKARKLLKQGLDMCGSAGLDKHPIAARTHIHMGVVMMGMSQRDLAVKQFRKALDIQPDIQVTRNVANPDVLAAFKEASDAAPASGGGDSGGGDTGGAGDDAGEGGAKAGGKSSDDDGDSGGAPTPGSPAATGIIHTPVKQAKKDAAVLITAKMGSNVSGYQKVILFFKSDDDEDFTAKNMVRAAGKFAAEIPASSTGGAKVAYYIEAQDNDETALAAAGGKNRPFVIALGGAGGGGAVAKKCAPDDEDCVETPASGGGSLFFALMGGSGFGYATGNGDLTSLHKVKNGFAPSSIAQISPEVGYFIAPDWRLSLQGRIQIVSGGTPLNSNDVMTHGGGTPCGSAATCPPKTLAVAVLAKSTWLFGSGSFRPFVSAELGGGQIRHLVKFGQPNLCGSGGGGVCIDSVTAGPILVGGGVGVSYGFTDSLGLIVELDNLLAFTKFSFHVDLNAGLALRI